MPSTHTSLRYHLVFSTKNRERWLTSDLREKLFPYLGGIIRQSGGVALAVGGVEDHVHLLVSLKASPCLADILRELKSESSRWMRDDQQQTEFGWQEGYGAFTVSANDTERVRSYVLRQEEHHRTTTFQEEYVKMLERGMVEYDERYLW